MNIKKILATGLASAYLAFAPINPTYAAEIKEPAPIVQPVKGPTVTVEPVFRGQSTMLDTKLSGTLAKNIGYFMRNQTSVDYENDNNTSAFSFIDLTHKLGNGFNAAVEVQFPDGMPADPRAGIQYFKDFGNGANVFGSATRSFGPNPNTEIVVIPAYEREINGVRVGGRLEALCNFSDEDLNFALARLRAGVGKDNIMVGAALDVSGIGSGNPTYTPGVFVQAKLK